MSRTRVLDWRDLPGRLAARERDGAGSPWWARAGGGLTGWLNRAVIAARVASRGTPSPRPPLIVSVGNLRVGGTGKTPVTIDLAHALAGRGRTGAVVTRGHGSALRGPVVVSPGDAAAGDEARLIAAALPAWTVIQSANRDAGLSAALARHPDVVVLEDGHQSAGTGRHLDVVILDRWHVVSGGVVPLAGPVLPWGPYREGAEGAARAAVWLVEAQPGAAAPPVPGAGHGAARVLVFRRELRLAGGEPPPQGVWAAICGLASPLAFEAGAARLLGRPAALVVRAPDHARYTPRQVARALGAGRGEGVDFWLTTAKDAVKLRAIWPATPPLRVVELSLEWLSKETLPDLVGERLDALRAGRRPNY